MGRFFALTLAALMGLGLLSMSLAQAQDAYGGIHGNSGTANPLDRVRLELAET